MEEMLYKFIDEGKHDQEEMRAFIHEFKTTNELLFKERNNSLSELRRGSISYESFECKAVDDSDSGELVRHIKTVNTPYPVAQKTTEPNKVESEQLYSANTNEIDEKKPELQNLPQHLEYAYLHGDKSFPIIISSKLSKREKMLLLQDSSKFRLHPDQEKTTFTCPYGTFAYRRMSFGLCNAPATFQRCMTAIFHDMVEDYMEVFMHAC
ncbi:hypothetical protein Tco_0276244 [Tanacetum coccineum]